MNRRNQVNLTAIAVLLSLVVHAIVIAAIAAFAPRQFYLAFERPRPEPESVTLIPPIELPPLEELETFPMGDATGLGEANSRSEAEGVQKAPNPLRDQAALTRDPEGNRSANKPSPPAPPEVAALASASEPQAFRPPAQELMLNAAPIGRQAKVSPKEPVPGKDAKTQEEQLARAAQPADAPPMPQVQPAKPVPAAQTLSGTPLEHSDRDSDLFAAEVSVKFERGRVQALEGREVKFARPRDNLAAFVDTATIPSPAVLRMQIAIDAKGTVRNIKILRGTGSKTLDHILELATYASWFEPLKDEAGTPKPDEFSFAIELH